MVIWGTMYPTITEAIFKERTSVSSIWFNEWITPLATIVLFLTGAGPLLAWKSTSYESLVKNFRWPSFKLFDSIFYLYWL